MMKMKILLSFLLLALPLTGEEKASLEELLHSSAQDLIVEINSENDFSQIEEVFKTELNICFDRLKTRHTWPDVSLTPSDKNIKLLCRLQLPNGNIEPKPALQLADLAEPNGAVLRINLEHGLEVYGRQAIQLPQSLAVLENNPIIVACPGSTTCTRGFSSPGTSGPVRGSPSRSWPASTP